MWRLLICLAVLLPGGSGYSLAEPSTTWPTRAWPVSTPGEQGMDRSLLDNLDRRFAGGDYGYIDHMLIIRNGNIVYDRSYARDYEKISGDLAQPTGMYNYYDPLWHPYYKGTALHSMQSVTKSVTSLAIGRALLKGQIPDTDVRLEDYFSDYAGPGFDIKKRITLEDLLSMRAGIQWDESSYPYTDARNSCGQMEHSEDWVAYVIAQPMAAEPGAEFLYNSGASQLLSHIIRQATGMYVDEYLDREIFSPLGIDQYYWKRTPTGLPDTEGGLYLTPHDLARIGYLYLMDGVWEGVRLLPEGWVKNTVTARSKDVPSRGAVYDYGLQWWLLRRPDEGASPVYAARGYGGQLLYIAPEENLIAVFTGWNIFEGTRALPVDVLFDYVLNAVDRPAGKT